MCDPDGDEHRASFEVRSTEVIKARAAFEPRFAVALVPEKGPIEGFDLRTVHTVHTCHRILISVYDCVRAASVIAAPRGIALSSEILTAIDRSAIGNARLPRW